MFLINLYNYLTYYSFYLSNTQLEAKLNSLSNLGFWERGRFIIARKDFLQQKDLSWILRNGVWIVSEEKGEHFMWQSGMSCFSDLRCKKSYLLISRTLWYFWGASPWIQGLFDLCFLKVYPSTWHRVEI